MNLSIMKVEAVVFGVMRAVMINCESILPGLKTQTKCYFTYDIIQKVTGKVPLH